MYAVKLIFSIFRHFPIFIMLSSISNASDKSTALRTEAIVFDFDGTLADTLPLITASWNAALRDFLPRPHTVEDVVARFGPTEENMLRAHLHAHDQATVDAAIERYFAHYTSAHALVQPFEGVTEMLHQTRARGYKCGLMTGKAHRAAMITLELLGWQDEFEVIITGDDIARAKPDPEGIFKALQVLATPPERAIYLGDMEFDIEAARAAGCRAFAAGWHAHDAASLRATQPDAWLEKPEDLWRFV